MEITDLLWQVDAAGARLPVAKGDVLTRLRQGGQHRAARIVSAIPAGGGILDPDYVDALGVRVHCELQQLGEELRVQAGASRPCCPRSSTRCAGTVLARCASSTSDAGGGSSCARWRPARPWALMSSWSASTSTRSWSPRPACPVPSQELPMPACVTRKCTARARNLAHQRSSPGPPFPPDSRPGNPSRPGKPAQPGGPRQRATAGQRAGRATTLRWLCATHVSPAGECPRIRRSRSSRRA